MRLDRTNTSLVGRWWWTVDHLNLAALLLLLVFGAILVAAGSPPVAKRLELPMFYFVHRQYAFLVVGLAVMLVISMFSPPLIRRFAVVGFCASMALMLVVPFIGIETKGAHRWIALGGFSVQPSEFMKPFFAVVMAWICAENQKRVDFPGYTVAIGLYLAVALLLIIQPDFGMTLTVSAMWAIQLFLAGLPMIWVIMIGLLGVAGAVAAYSFLPHVARRIDSFLDPSSGDNYQISRSLEAFKSGGVFGQGPGEGEVKQTLPDSHTDFIFAVAGEEFGVIFCMVVLGLFAFIVLRGLSRVWRHNDLFVLLAVAGILSQFGIQAIINMGVAVNLFPAKGMTLPFVSYGGSSVVAIAIGMGMMLALTRKKYGNSA
ncbi:MAG: putative lipid II flippase FtsW [Rickettsiales bacterium]|jgi:cell division protein FtsW|nr:putative lipid II flippase FtsW [Rickettsiales bacterium]